MTNSEIKNKDVKQSVNYTCDVLLILCSLIFINIAMDVNGYLSPMGALSLPPKICFGVLGVVALHEGMAMLRQKLAIKPPLKFKKAILFLIGVFLVCLQYAFLVFF